MDRTQKTDEQLETLASHLTSRRESILQTWRDAVAGDPNLTAPSALPRTQFYDHIPQLLDALEKRLRAWPNAESTNAQHRRHEDAANHGLQRWQQGYHLREVAREWRHLHLCLAAELENYSLAHADLEPGVMPMAWRALSEVCSQGVCDSTTRYFQLQQAEAEGHFRDMENTLEEVRKLEQRRTELFRQAAHDLRGNVGVVKNVTWGLTQQVIPEPMREELLRLLQSSVSSLHSMLDEVMDLARLQAGRESRDVKPFDVAELLTELVANAQPLAEARGLYLKMDGPAKLPVEGDAVKIRRIVQNVLLNALKYTNEGGVTVEWGDSRTNDPKRWMLCVQDTGPGYHAGPGAPLAAELKEATLESRQVEEHASRKRPGDTAAQPVPSAPASQDNRPVHQERGEGVGLSIVKRLCELLDASVELESKPNVGTTFRILFPRHY